LHAKRAHDGQLRASGKPYLIHPVGVADTLMQLSAKPEVIAAGLLHDVLEDTDENFKILEHDFDFELAKIVNAVTQSKKMERIKKNHPAEKRRLLHHQFLDTIKDIRSALVKLADRLDNCRTLEYLPAEKQHEIAEETLKMYVPLARQAGFDLISRELESICLDILPKWDFQRAQTESLIFEQEIAEKGYHQNKLDECLIR